MRRPKTNIPKPDYFTRSWYEEQKALRKSNQQIADEMFVSLTTLKRMLREIGFLPGEGLKYLGSKYKVPPIKMKKLLDHGYSKKKIAELVGVSYRTVLHALKKYDGKELG